MRDVFSRLIPLLGAQKSDNKKWVFAATICLISESINDYLENTERYKYNFLTLYMVEVLLFKLNYYLNNR